MNDLQQDLDELVQVFSISITKQGWKSDRKHVAKAISEIEKCSDQPEYRWLLEQLHIMENIYADKYSDGGFKRDIASGVANVLQRHGVPVNATREGDFEVYLDNIYIRLKVPGNAYEYVRDAVKIRKMAALLTPKQINPY